ncbi:MAG: helix-turn-helix transcriptional regulator [Oscillospiraceae bacterium]|nr:helix-turn-helix transcriptional regulator [Oscillospiraceae bacterium]
MFSQENFSKRIFELRKQHNLSQEAFGKAAGIKKNAVGMIEKGKRAASIEVIVALADYFDVSVDYLIGRSDIPER